MVKDHATGLNDTFGALADPTRRAILERLATEELTVSELAAPFPMSLPAITKHLSVLKRAGLITQTKLGRIKRCSLAADPLREATAWMASYRKFWDSRLAAVAEFVEEDK